MPFSNIMAAYETCFTEIATSPEPDLLPLREIYFKKAYIQPNVCCVRTRSPKRTPCCVRIP